MRRWNIYYIQNGRSYKRSYPIIGLLYVVESMALQGIEITGIIEDVNDQ